MILADYASLYHFNKPIVIRHCIRIWPCKALKKRLRIHVVELNSSSIDTLQLDENTKLCQSKTDTTALRFLFEPRSTKISKLSFQVKCLRKDNTNNYYHVVGNHKKVKGVKRKRT